MSQWDSADYGLAALAALGIKADADSTKRLIERGGVETNPLLGKNPSGAELDKVGALTALAGLGGAAMVPDSWRKPLLGVWAGLEHGLAKYNESYNAKKGGGKFQDGIGAALPYAAIGGLLGYAMTGDNHVSISASKDKGNAVNLLLGYKTDF